MRSITPIVAIVVLMLMTVSAAGMAFLTITSYQGEAQSGTQAGIETIGSRTRTQLRIESISDGQIYLRNLGQETFSNPSFYVEGKPLNVSGPIECESGDICVYTVLEEVDCEGDCEINMGADASIGTSITVDEEQITAYSITTFSDGSSEKNLTFNQQGSQIANITLPLSSTVSSATLNLEGSKTWSESLNISQTAGNSYDVSFDLDSSGNIHFFWRDYTPGNYEIFYRNLTSNVLSELINITETSERSMWPFCAFDSQDNLHLVWQDEPTNLEVFYKNRTNGLWSQTEDLSPGSENAYVTQLVLDSSDNLHVVWHDPVTGTPQVHYRNRTAGVWSQTEIVSPTSGNSLNGKLAFDSLGNLHMVWWDYYSGNYEILYRNRTNGVWSPVHNLSQNSAISSYPKFAIDSQDNLHVVWADEQASPQSIFYMNRTNLTGEWSVKENIFVDSAGAYRPMVAIDSLDIPHVVWDDDNPSGRNILYKNLTNGVWSEVLNISQTTTTSSNPYIMFDSFDNMHLAWLDNIPGNNDVYYKYLSSTKNPAMVAGSTGLDDWSYSSYFNTTSSATFASKLNSILSTCSCPSCSNNGTHCTIGLNFTTDSAGKIKISNLNILYT